MLTRASFAYLLSLLPGVNLGADSLRRALFDFGTRAKLQDDERRALRIIRGAAEHDLHWAERPLLQSTLNRAVQHEALKRGIGEAALRHQFRTGADPETSAEIISEALRTLATDKIAEEDLRAAKKRIRDLEEELRAARSGANEATAQSTRRS